MKPTFIDLFGAPGGMSKGFQMAGFKPLGMLDIFEEGVNTYRKNFLEVPKKKCSSCRRIDARYNKIF